MKTFIKICLVLILILVGASYVSAQESATTTQEEMMNDNYDSSMEMQDEMSDDTMSDDTMMDENEEGSMETTEELSEEEIAEILEEEEVLGEEEVEDLGDLEGEVVGVTEDEVIIETEDGEIIVVDSEVYETKTSKSGGSSRRKAKVGETVEIVSVVVVEKSDDGMKITTNSGTYFIPKNTPVTVNGNNVAVKDLKNLATDAEIVVVTDNDGNVVALEVIGELERASSKTLVASIIAVVVIILLALVFRKRRVV